MSTPAGEEKGLEITVVFLCPGLDPQHFCQPWEQHGLRGLFRDEGNSGRLHLLEFTQLLDKARP